MLGYFGGETTKIPPHTLSLTEIPKDPHSYICFLNLTMLKLGKDDSRCIMLQAILEGRDPPR
jgi:hypothetical protein